jgi:hypothetical protein
MNIKCLPAIIAMVVLGIFAGIFFGKKNAPKDFRAVILVAGSFFLYHFGDMGMWAGWHYELFRRIASLGYYLEMPAMLYLAYLCLPESKRTGLVKGISLLLALPWAGAIIALPKYPNNFLEYPNIPQNIDPGKHEELVMALILIFAIGVVIVAVNAFRAAKYREGAAKCFCKAIGWATIVMLIAEFVLFSLVEAIKYDSTYLFGFISLTWILWVGLKANRYFSSIKQ